jgi:hypothetical protein
MRRLRKTFTFFSHLLLICVLSGFAVQLMHGGVASLPFGLAGAALALNVMLGGMALVLFDHLLRSYTVIFARLISWELMLLGTLCSIVTLLFAGSTLVVGAGCVFLASWTAFAYYYWRNAQLFEKQGAGPLPKGTCLRVPEAALKPGDVLATSGMMAKLLHQSVGHTEVVIPWQGKNMLFSSWFETGACLNEPRRIVKPSDRNHYYVLRRKSPLTDEQIQRVEREAAGMLEQNKAYIERTKAHRERMPRLLKRFLDWKFPVTGYDYFGKYTGRIAPDRWTCTGIYLELMRRSEISTIKLGQGIAGLGTGWFDFLNTEELTADRDLELVMDHHLDELGIAHDCSEQLDAPVEVALHSEE